MLARYRRITQSEYMLRLYGPLPCTRNMLCETTKQAHPSVIVRTTVAVAAEVAVVVVRVCVVQMSPDGPLPGSGCCVLMLMLMTYWWRYILSIVAVVGMVIPFFPGNCKTLSRRSIRSGSRSNPISRSSGNGSHRSSSAGFRNTSTIGGTLPGGVAGPEWASYKDSYTHGVTSFPCWT